MGRVIQLLAEQGRKRKNRGSRRTETRTSCRLEWMRTRDGLTLLLFAYASEGASGTGFRCMSDPRPLKEAKTSVSSHKELA
jgi:hypothetical protein